MDDLLDEELLKEARRKWSDQPWDDDSVIHFPEYGEVYPIVKDQVRGDETGTIYEIKGSSVIPKEVKLWEPVASDDNDIIDKSGEYIYGHDVLDPITGELLHAIFSDISEGDIQKLVDKGIERINIIPKDDKEKIDLFKREYLAGPMTKVLDSIVEGTQERF